MTRVRRRAAAGLAAGLLAVLAGCTDDQERYCQTLQEQRQVFGELAGRSDDEVLDDTVDVLDELHDRAPGDIRDEWSTVLFAYRGLSAAFAEAGVAPSEVGGGGGRDGLTEQQRDLIEAAAAELRTPRVMGAADAIEQHARDVCKIDLGLSG